MNTAEIDEIRKDTIMSRDYLESANLETIYLNDVIRNLCDELEKAQAVVERVRVGKEIAIGQYNHKGKSTYSVEWLITEYGSILAPLDGKE